MDDRVEQVARIIAYDAFIASATDARSGATRARARDKARQIVALLDALATRPPPR